MEIFNKQSKFVVFDMFSNIFTKSLIENMNVRNFLLNIHKIYAIKKILPYIMACTCCFTSGLHQVFDNVFFSEILKQIITKLRQQPIFTKEKGNFNEKFFILKNISLIFSYFYIFDSISLDFLYEYISFLLQDIDNEIVEILLNLLQNTGLKIRKDNPKLLKEIIELTKTSFDRYKAEKNVNGFEKGDFLLMILNDIKLNKNIKNNPFETLSFLLSWLKKNVIQKMKIVQKVFSLDFKTTLNADFTKRKWWELSISTNENDEINNVKLIN